jgi:tetratricopeptide (TPR) repeat protein
MNYLHLSKLASRISICYSIVVFVLLLILTAPVAAAYVDQDNDERSRAFRLYKEAKYIEALPAFEKFAASHPEDKEVIETLGFLVVSQTAYLKDPVARKEARKRGREILLRAQKLGAESALLRSMLAAIPEDGGEDTNFSTRKEVDDAMREGEAAFASGNFSKAVESYQRALLFDPKVYEAALFTGDVYYKTGEQQKAGEWFARAVAIDPNRETAYRYWGDSLMHQGRLNDARHKFIEAFIAEPYNRLARAGFVNWGQKANVVLAHPKLEIPTSVTPQQNGQTTINLDPKTLKEGDKTGSGAAWMMYGIVRASWVTTEFAKQYPKEKTYRHSLKEEATAFRAALKVLNEKDAKEIDPSLRTAMKLDKEGLLEAYILLAMADSGIAQDFAEYRKSNLENLRRYVVQYVVAGGGQ